MLCPGPCCCHILCSVIVMYFVLSLYCWCLCFGVLWVGIVGRGFRFRVDHFWGIVEGWGMSGRGGGGTSVSHSRDGWSGSYHITSQGCLRLVAG